MRLLPLALLAIPALAVAQGALTPPGAPAPTMKTLDQIEPRIPLQAGAPGVTVDAANGKFHITTSGSYYLTGNLTVTTGNAIYITGSNVTLDLCGYTIRSSAAAGTAGSAVLVSGGSGEVRTVTIRNGHIGAPYAYNTPSGFQHAVQGGTNTSVAVEDLAVFWTYSSAIALPISGRDGGSVRRCIVRGCPAGITASTAIDCVVTDATGTGIEADVVTDCHAASTGDAIVAGVARNSTGTSITGDGLRASRSASGCSGETASGRFGLAVFSADQRPIAGTAENCRGVITGTASVASVGLYAGTANNCIGINVSAVGLFAETATGCKGTSTDGIGMRVFYSATGCVGQTTSGSYGLYVRESTSANGTAENCRGIAVSGTGLQAECAINCFGESNSTIGLSAAIANNCSAYTASGSTAMWVSGTATGCRGNNGSEGGRAIEAAIAIGCTAAAGTIEAANKYNMP